MVNYNIAFRKPFTDIKKLLIGIALSILPIINWFSRGFILECSGLGKNKPGKKMPEWKNFGDLFLKGFLSLIIKIVYMLPALIIFILSRAYILFITFTYLIGNVIPVELLEKATTDKAVQDAITNIIKGNLSYIIPFLVKIIPIAMLGLLLFLIALYLVPAAVLTFIRKKSFSSAFNLPLVFRKAFRLEYFLAILTWLGVLIVGSMVMAVIPIIGRAILFFISGVIGYSLLGQAYKEEKGGKRR